MKEDKYGKCKLEMEGWIMESLKILFQKHKKLFYGFMILSPIFFGCFTFPFWNLTHESYVGISAINIFVYIIAYYDIGLAEAIAFYKKSFAFILGYNFIMSSIGLMCRYILEFGEISNTYNFTWTNILVHSLLAVLISSLTYLCKRKEV